MRRHSAALSGRCPFAGRIRWFRYAPPPVNFQWPSGPPITSFVVAGHVEAGGGQRPQPQTRGAESAGFGIAATRPRPQRGRLQRWLAAAALAILAGAPAAWAQAGAFRSVEVTFHGGKPEELKECIDGIRTGPRGWRVHPRVGENQSAIFRTVAPVNADTLQMVLCFFSGRPNSAIAEFSISSTTDPEPSFSGHWEPLRIISFRAEGTTLTQTAEGHLRAREEPHKWGGTPSETVYYVNVRTERQGITGFRLDAFPVVRAGGPSVKSPDSKLPVDAFGPVLSWSFEGDFILTEFRADPWGTSTNVALGAAVKASHPLFARMKPDFLTDGRPSTFAHPKDPGLGAAFHFDIDLGRIVKMDHLLLRGRNDGAPHTDNRLSRLLVEIFDDAPDGGAKPVWQTLPHTGGSSPKESKAEVLKAGDGRGEFRGRFIRLSSDSPVPLSPQIAEVEVYETRTPELVSVRADGRVLPVKGALSVPDGSVMTLTLIIPQPGNPQGNQYRWRLEGLDNDWQLAQSRLLYIPCPRPGNYVLRAQARHSDGTWDASAFSIPITVPARFTETWAFLGLLGCGALVTGALITLFFDRKRVARLKTQTAMAEERARIARDMHDAVGARLSQLSFLAQAASGEPAGKDDLERISRTAGEALASLDEVVWTVNPKNDTLESMAHYLARYASRYLDPVGIACRIDTPVEWPEVNIRAQTRHEVALAFKEALQNVVKHSGATETMLKLRLESGRLVITLRDNGCGLPESPAGFEQDGLTNMKTRLASVGGTCSIRRLAEGGTEVEMHLTLPRR